VTSDLIKRVYEHKQDIIPGFTETYGCKLLVYYAQCDCMIGALSEKNKLKGAQEKRNENSLKV